MGFNSGFKGLILILDSRCWWLVSVTLRTHYSRRKPSRYTMSRKAVWDRGTVWKFWRRDKFSPGRIPTPEENWWPGWIQNITII